MHSKVVRFIYAYGAVPRWLLSLVVPGPVLLNLGEFEIYVRLDDWAVGARIAARRNYEPHVTKVIRSFLRPGAVVVDIGANIGYYTLLAAARTGDTGKVIAFEPSSSSCALVEKSARRNNFHNIIIHNKAVVSNDGHVRFGGKNGTNGSIKLDIVTGYSTLVEAVALDTFLQNETRIDVIKMDIEGAEGLALKGMRQLLQRHHPVIVTEFSPDALRDLSGVQPEDFLNDMRTLGYQVSVIAAKGFWHGLPQSNEEIMRIYRETQSDHLDLLAQHPARRL